MLSDWGRWCFPNFLTGRRSSSDKVQTASRYLNSIDGPVRFRKIFYAFWQKTFPFCYPRVESFCFPGKISSPTYFIKLNVEQFDGQFGKHVILDVTWSAAKQKDDNDPLVKNSLIKEPISTEDYEAIVAAKSRAIAVLSQEIVSIINTTSNK